MEGEGEIRQTAAKLDHQTNEEMPMLRNARIATSGSAKTAWFKDSEGNILAISPLGFQHSALVPRYQELLVRDTGEDNSCAN